MCIRDRTRSEETDNDEVAEEEHDLPGATSRTLEEALEPVSYTHLTALRVNLHNS